MPTGFENSPAPGGATIYDGVFRGGSERLSASVLHFVDKGDPNTLSDPSIRRAGIGSTFTRIDAPDQNHIIYVCTTSGVSGPGATILSSSVWQAIAIP